MLPTRHVRISRGDRLARMGLTDFAALAEPGELIWFCDTHKTGKTFCRRAAGTHDQPDRRAAVVVSTRAY